MEAKDFARLVVEKLGPRQRHSYVPPVPDRLFEELGIEDDEESQAVVQMRARHFLHALGRMSPEERKVLFAVFLEGYPRTSTSMSISSDG
jgi:DNA-directed RNA polymerase specialized sigma24 family protein